MAGFARSRTTPAPSTRQATPATRANMTPWRQFFPRKNTTIARGRGRTPARAVTGWSRGQDFHARVDGLEVGDGHAKATGQLHHRTSDRIDLEGPSRLEVLEHRGLVVADSRGSADALVDRHGDLDPEAAGDRVHLLHGRSHHGDKHG